ncbi:MAG: transporter substrate-binding domain-containing protein [Lachnospiraceae bacterium]|nr:transporter substrate-binding domain-containing protein [Lachnospiraceae bacterium]
MMKKIIAMILAGAMAVSMTACAAAGTAATTAANDAAEAVQETTEAVENAAEAAGEVAEAVAEAAGFTTVADGVLTMGTNAYFPPYEYYEGSEIVGIDAEIAAAIAEKLGLTLKIEDMEFDSIITAVTTGKVDMGLAGMTVTEERKENVNFSDSYATGVQVVIVKEDSDIASVDDLSDKMIGVQLGTTGDIYCSDDFGTDHVDQYNKGNDAVMALVSGKVDAVVIDNEPAKSYVAANEGLKILDTEYVTEEYAAAINKENTALLDAINGALAELKADGTLDAIVAKYINAD